VWLYAIMSGASEEEAVDIVYLIDSKGDGHTLDVPLAGTRGYMNNHVQVIRYYTSVHRVVKYRVRYIVRQNVWLGMTFPELDAAIMCAHFKFRELHP